MTEVVYRLDEVCSVTMGQAPCGEAYNSTGTGWPLIAGAGDFSNGRARAKKFTTEASKLSTDGDIVLGIRASIGAKVWSDGVYCLGRGVAGLRPRLGLDAGYLWHWLTHSAPALAAKGKGATFKQVNRQDIGEMPISLPPLDEQLRIAAILDQADAVRAKRREALAHLDDLTQSIFRDMFGDIGSDSDGPQRIPLNDLCTRITDGTHQSPSWSLDGNPFLFISNIVTGEIDFDTKRFISDQTHRLLTSRCPIEIGDVLYSTVGSYGVPALVRTDQKFAFQRHIAHIKPNRDLLEPEFLRAMLASPGVRRQADTAARGVAQKTVNLADIKKFSVVTPPMARQLKFVDRLSKVSELQRMHRSHLDGANDLFSALQTRAFAGEL